MSDNIIICGTDVDEIFEDLDNKILPGWKEFFEESKEELEFIKKKLKQHVDGELKCFLPLEKNVFRIFNNLDLEHIKVVIIDEAPYSYLLDNGVPAACGFAFSYPHTTKIPQMLKNMFFEIERDFMKRSTITNGDLCHLVCQGVFLLNLHLTISFNPMKKENWADKHGIWKCFTIKALEYIFQNTDAIFIVFGDKLRNEIKSILSKKNEVLDSNHPNDQYGRKKFLGCGVFKKANDILVKRGLEPILWNPIPKVLDDSYWC